MFCSSDCTARVIFNGVANGVRPRTPLPLCTIMYIYIYVYSSRRIEYLLYSRFRHQSRPVRGHSHGRGQPFLESGRRYRLGHIDEFFLRGTAQKESRITYRNPHFRVNVVAPDPNKRVHAVYCFTTVYIYLHIEYCSCGLFELGKIIVW